jgi:hypothetical protein
MKDRKIYKRCGSYDWLMRKFIHHFYREMTLFQSLIEYQLLFIKSNNKKI